MQAGRQAMCACMRMWDVGGTPPFGSPGRALLPLLQMIYQVTVERARLDIPEDAARCPRALRAIILKCWDEQPRLRPTAEELLEQLEAVAATIDSQ